MAPRAANTLDLRVQAAFLGPHVSFEPTRPLYKHHQAHLVDYEKEESALLAHDFKYWDAAFAPLHRNLLALRKILPDQDTDVSEREQAIVQRLQEGAALGSTAFVSRLVSTFREPPATGLSARISWWKAEQDNTDAAAQTPGTSRIQEMSKTVVTPLAPLGAKQPPPAPRPQCPHPGSGDANRPQASLLVFITSATYSPKAKRKR